VYYWSVSALTFDANNNTLIAGLSYYGEDSELVSYPTYLTMALGGPVPVALPVVQYISSPLATPAGIAVDGDTDNVFVTNQNFGFAEGPPAVVEFNAGSQVTGFSLNPSSVSPPLAAPVGIALGYSNIYVSDPQNNTIDIFPNSATSLCAPGNPACVTEPYVFLGVQQTSTSINAPVPLFFGTVGLPAASPPQSPNCTLTDNSYGGPYYSFVTAPTSSLPGASSAGSATLYVNYPQFQSETGSYTVGISCNYSGYLTTPTTTEPVFSSGGG
jgi:hypothetical protein